MSSTFIVIAASTLALIGFATLLNVFLLKKSPQNETFKKTMVIIKSWWIIIVFALACMSVAPYGLYIGLGGLSLVGIVEYMRHSRLQELRKPVGVLVAIAVCAQYASLYGNHWNLFFALPLGFLLFGTSILVIFYARIDRLAETFASYTGLLFMFHFIAYLPALYILQSRNSGHDSAIKMVFLLMLITEVNDVFQFLCGKAFGKRKVFPVISPNKTEAGFIGGFILTVLLSGVLFQHLIHLPLSKALILGAIISLSGMMGDLTFSSIKRYFQTKDFSDMLPGHGGILDRLDSLIYTTPVVFYFIYFSGTHNWL